MKDKKDIQCKHYKGDGFGYDISDEEKLYLCEQCNLNLAEGIFSQAALNIFAPSIFGDD